MNILMVLSQTQLTGAEVYAVTLANRMIQDGHKVYIVSDKLHCQTQAEYISQPIDKRKYKQRIKNIRFLKELVEEKQIDIIHANSRASSWVCDWVSRLTGVTYISTVHGRQHVHFSSKMRDIYGQAIIAVCAVAKQTLHQDLGIKSEKIHVIPNPMEDLSVERKAADSTWTLSVLGRTTGPKGQRTVDLLKFVFPELLQKFPQLHIRIAGGDSLSLGEETLKHVNELNRKFQNRISLQGYVKGLQSELAQTQLVIGSGRVALEAILCQIPVIALGEYGCHFLVTEKNLTAAMGSNFGDMGVDSMYGPVDYHELKLQIAELVETHSQPAQVLEKLHEAVLQNYNLENIYAKVMQLYRSTRFRKLVPKHIPVLMYHKVSDENLDSKHRIFVTPKTFEKHLRLFSWMGLKSITFQELEDFREAKIKSLPKKPILLTFDDGYVDNLQNALPLLKKYMFRAVIFILGDSHILRNEWDVKHGEKPEQLMNLAQKRELLASGTIEYGSHGMSHRDLTKLTPSEIKVELESSKSQLEKDFSIPIRAFAYPYGYLNEQVEQLAQGEYQFAVATDQGGLRMEDNWYRIFRTPVFPQDGYWQIFRKSSSWYRRYFFKKHRR